MKKEYIEIEGLHGIIRGIIHFPANYDCDKCYSMVLFVVGLNGNRVDLNRVIIDAANEFQRQNFFCMRFDFWGMGCSDGFFSESSITTKTDDLIEICNFIKKNCSNIEKLIILSLSDGMQIVVNALNIDPLLKENRFIFWSPILIDTDNLLVETQHVRPQREPYSKKICLPFMGLWMSLEYFKEKKNIDFVSRIKSVSEILLGSLVIYAIDDGKVHDTLELLRKYDCVIEHVHEGGHSFYTYSSHWKAINTTTDFILNIGK